MQHCTKTRITSMVCNAGLGFRGHRNPCFIIQGLGFTFFLDPQQLIAAPSITFTATEHTRYRFRGF